MAAGAFQADTEEELAEHGGEFLGTSPIPKDCYRAVSERASLRGKQVMDKAVIGLVLPEVFSHPAIQAPYGFDADAVGVRSQEIDPFVGPVIRILGPGEQAVHKLSAFRGIFSGEKGFCLLGSGEPADDIDVGSPEIFRIVALGGRLDLQAFEFFPDEFIDEIIAPERAVILRRDLSFQRDVH